MLLSTLAINDLLILNEEEDANLTTTSGIVSYLQNVLFYFFALLFQTGGDFIVEERRFLDSPPLFLNRSIISPHCHDATWTLAYALNKTLKSKLLLGRMRYKPERV